jgi:actin related protein 2/3 complex subunit 5
MKAITAVKEEDIPKVLATLDPDECDTLMKYIYRGLAAAQSCGALLKWHEQTTSYAGTSCIVRAITDRKGL